MCIYEIFTYLYLLIILDINIRFFFTGGCYIFLISTEEIASIYVKYAVILKHSLSC